jgi:lipoyl-dependent peroxiredoxin
MPYSYRTRFENENGTNPEELIAAAHAGCFTMALAFRLLDQDTFDRVARDAEQNCPVSRVLRAEITLDAKLL